MHKTKWYAKPLYVIMALALVLGLTLVPATPALAQEAEATMADVDMGLQNVVTGAQFAVQTVTISDSGGAGDGLPTLVDSFAVTNTGGTAVDADVTAVAVYQDADADDVWQSSDTLIGSVTDFTAAAAIGIDDNTVCATIANGESETFFVVVTVASDATLGNTFKTNIDGSDLVDTGSSTYTGASDVDATSATTIFGVTYPTATGVLVQGTVAITWESSSLDAGAARFNLEYSPDSGTTWFSINPTPLGSGIRTYGWDTTAPAVGEGSTYKVRVTEETASTVDASDNVFTVDNTEPNAPAITDFTATGGTVVADYINASNSGFTVTFDSPATEYAGTAHLYVGDALFSTDITTAVSAASTEYTLTGDSTSITELGSDGAKALTVKIIDAAGNVGAASTSYSINKDIAVPSKPVITSIATDEKINDSEKAAIVVIGTAEANALVSVSLSDGTNTITGSQQLTGGATDYSVTLDGTAATPGALVDGTITPSVTATDAAGNVSSADTDPTATQDTVAPNAPTIGDFTATGETVVADYINDSNTGFTQKFTSPATEYAGKAHLYVGGELFTTDIQTTVSAASTEYTLTGDSTSITELGSDGAKALTVKIIDAAENVGAVSAAKDITLDTGVPAVTVTHPHDAITVPQMNVISGSITEAFSISPAEINIQRAADSKYWDGDSADWVSGDTWNDVTVAGAAPDFTFSYDSSAITGEDTYTVTARATDPASNEGTSSSITYTIAPEVTSWDIELWPGWNLISLPLVVTDGDNIDTVLDSISGDFTIVRYYTTTDTTEEWLRYIAPGEDNTLLAMEDGKGYWVHMTARATLTISGTAMPTGGELPPSYPVVVGWNLIGFKSILPMDNAAYLSDLIVSGSSKYVILWGYSPDEGYFNVYPKGAHSGKMEVGHGYWLWATAEGTILPKS